MLALAGEPVAHARDLGVERVATGAPVVLAVPKADSGGVVDVEIVAWPNTELPPIPAAPPFWSVGAADLDRAPVRFAASRLSWVSGVDVNRETRRSAFVGHSFGSPTCTVGEVIAPRTSPCPGAPVVS